MWQVGPRISWSTQGQTYSVLTSYSRAFFSPTCTILGMTGKTTTKRFTWAFLCCWDGQIFPPPQPPAQFLVVPECSIPLLGRDLSLPSKSYSYCSPDRRCFKTLLLGANYVYQPPSETTPEWEKPSMDV